MDGSLAGEPVVAKAGEVVGILLFDGVFGFVEPEEGVLLNYMSASCSTLKNGSAHTDLDNPQEIAPLQPRARLHRHAPMRADTLNGGEVLRGDVDEDVLQQFLRVKYGIAGGTGCRSARGHCVLARDSAFRAERDGEAGVLGLVLFVDGQSCLLVLE